VIVTWVGEGRYHLDSAELGQTDCPSAQVVLASQLLTAVLMLVPALESWEKAKTVFLYASILRTPFYCSPCSHSTLPSSAPSPAASTHSSRPCRQNCLHQAWTSAMAEVSSSSSRRSVSFAPHVVPIVSSTYSSRPRLLPDPP
jgi:hypothetical protein